MNLSSLSRLRLLLSLGDLRPRLRDLDLEFGINQMRSSKLKIGR